MPVMTNRTAVIITCELAAPQFLATPIILHLLVACYITIYRGFLIAFQIATLSKTDWKESQAKQTLPLLSLRETSPICIDSCPSTFFDASRFYRLRCKR